MSKIVTYDPRFSILKRNEKNGKNSTTILQDNRNLLLQLIREKGIISRKQLAEESGLQQATVTIIIKEFLEHGLIYENGMIEGGNGRCVKGFSIKEDFYVVSIRLNGVYIKMALYDIHIHSTHVKKIFFQTDDYINESLELIQIYLKEIEAVVPRENILCIILGVEHVYRLIENDYSIWDDKKKEYCPIGKQLHDLTHYKVFSNRGINFAAYDVWNRFKAKHDITAECAMMIHITISYDLESAIIVNGELVYGMEGMCGQIGNLYISREDRKTYNDVLTVPALLNRAKELLAEYPDSIISGIQDLNIRDVIAGYDSGDELCQKVYNEVIYYLGFIVAQFINWLDPDFIFIGDEIPESKQFITALKNEISRYCGSQNKDRINPYMRKRITSNDPVLIGGAKYGFDLMIDVIGIYN